MSSPLEADVGITEYVSKLPGFNAILKHRFRDFQVREVDPRGQVARLTSLEPLSQVGPGGSPGAAPAAAAPAPATRGEFDPAKLAAARPQLVASFAALAGPENGAVLDELLRRVTEMYGIKGGDGEEGEGGAKDGADSGAAAADGGETADCSGGGDAVVAAAEAPQPGTTAAADASAGPAADAVPNSEPGVNTTQAAAGAAAASPATEAQPACAAASAGAGNGDGDGGGGGGDAGDRALSKVSVLLLPIASKDARKAVHEFFRTTPELPPMRTETTSTQGPTDHQQQQQQQQEEADPHQPPGSGGKRERPEDADEEPPAKWQKGGRGGRGGRGRGRGREGGGGGGGGGRGQQPPPQPKPQSSSRIQVVFDPENLRDGGGPGGEGGAGRGRGGGGGGGGGGMERGGGRGRGGGGGRGGHGRGGGEWEGGPHPFVRFVLYKENMDTQVALSTVSRLLGVPGGNCFGFAGTKDKRGVTCQFVTGFKVSPARLARLNPRLRGIRLGSFGFGDEGLRLGCLAGNEFHLLMRDVGPAAAATAATEQQQQQEAGTGAAAAGPASENGADLISQVTASCEAVARNGFINYFGLQRFGTGGAPTHEVGRALLRGEYEKAVRLVLTGRPDERPDIAAARRLFFEKGDIKGALRGLPGFMLGERAVLGALSRQGPSAWSAALLAVPRTLRMMYLHAWQSCVWNSAASHRIRMYGNDRAVVGDLVLPREPVAVAAGGGTEALLLDAGGGGGGGDDVAEAADGVQPEDMSEADGAATGTATAAASGAAGTSAARRLALVRVVSEADVAAGRYSVFDVVLPLPGTEVLYPDHETGAWIRKAAGEAGVDLDAPAASSAANRELSFASLTGDYRYLLHRPTHFHFAFKRYNDPNDDSLVLTDLELLSGRGRDANTQHTDSSSPPVASSNGGGAGAGGQPPPQPPQPPQRGSVRGSGPLLALELRFQLPSSCYATMLLRDLMKTSTSKSFHAGLSAAAAPTSAPAPASSTPAAAAEAAEAAEAVTAMEEDGPAVAAPAAQDAGAAAGGAAAGGGAATEGGEVPTPMDDAAGA
ncbi:hypothetical protein PLESTM_001332600 [Pleodorina starrii]|nr:hypothetical protein PLESTM_001332600 [Pleodorina starrii]